MYEYERKEYKRKEYRKPAKRPIPPKLKKPNGGHIGFEDRDDSVNLVWLSFCMNILLVVGLLYFTYKVLEHFGIWY